MKRLKCGNCGNIFYGYMDEKSPCCKADVIVWTDEMAAEEDERIRADIRYEERQDK